LILRIEKLLFEPARDLSATRFVLDVRVGKHLSELHLFLERGGGSPRTTDALTVLTTGLRRLVVNSCHHGPYVDMFRRRGSLLTESRGYPATYSFKDSYSDLGVALGSQAVHPSLTDARLDMSDPESGVLEGQ
jgi:hypothetical protein